LANFYIVSTKTVACVPNRIPVSKVIFNNLFRGSRNLVNDIAVPVIIKYVACPYCNTVFTAMTLASLRPYIDTTPYITKNGRELPNPRFKETHLANPINCPEQDHKFWVFVGVKYGSTISDIREVHILVSRNEDPIVSDLARWPHKGLVDPTVIEYSPSATYLYRSIEHYEQYNQGMEEMVAPETGSLSIAPPAVNPYSQQSLQDPIRIDLDQGQRSNGGEDLGIKRNIQEYK
jgi:hypothetical protein